MRGNAFLSVLNSFPEGQRGTWPWAGVDDQRVVKGDKGGFTDGKVRVGVLGGKGSLVHFGPGTL